MIFLKRAKKYIIKKLDDVCFYVGESPPVVINYLLYGNVVNDADDLEYFTNVSYEDLCKFWSNYDSTIMGDIVNFSHKSIYIYKSKKIAECNGCIMHLVYEWPYEKCPGFYRYINKTLYKYYLRDIDTMDIFIIKIRDCSS